MEFEEMKIIWDLQNNEPLYAINQDALHKQIKRKGKSITRSLDIVDVMMIIVNLLCAVFLIVDTLQDYGPGYEYALPGLYLVFFAYTLYRRFIRKQEVVGFGQSILEELDKAIWQADYLINQTTTMVFWYVLPLFVFASGIMLLNSKPLWALLLTVIVLPLTYLGGRWEVEKWHRPRKRELESLRAKLQQADAEVAARL